MLEDLSFDLMVYKSHAYPIIFVHFSENPLIINKNYFFLHFIPSQLELIKCSLQIYKIFYKYESCEVYTMLK